MDTSFEIGNHKLLPLKDTTKLVPYTRDYVARLAREGKIVAAQVNRQWYIDPQSLKNFFDQAQLELLARADYVRELRRNELETNEWLLSEATRLQVREVTALGRVLTHTVVVITLAVFVGLFVFSAAPFVERAPLSASVVDWQKALSEFRAAPLTPTVTKEESWWNNIGNVEVIDERMSVDAGIVILPQASSTSATATLEIFADPVSLERQGEHHGVLVGNVNGVTTTMPFVEIPDSATVESVPTIE